MATSKSIYYFLLMIYYQQNNILKAEPLEGDGIRESKSNEFPFIVSISQKSTTIVGEEEKGHYCGGSLISTKHVLTAAHCVIDNLRDMEVIVGTVDLRVGGNKYGIEEAKTYNQWASETCRELLSTDNDIAVLTLADCVSRRIKLAKLVDGYTNSDFYDKTATTAGWGRLNDDVKPWIQHTTTLNIISNAKCNEKVNEALKRYMDIFIWKRTLCSQNEPYTLLGCGDSGGPLFIKGNQIIGINESVCPNSKQFPRIQPGQGVNMHVGVVYYKSFIHNYLKESCIGCCIR